MLSRCRFTIAPENLTKKMVLPLDTASGLRYGNSRKGVTMKKELSEYFKKMGAKGGKAATGAVKRRGDSEYYRKLGKKGGKKGGK
jgi:general stress protein YciG